MAKTTDIVEHGGLIAYRQPNYNGHWYISLWDETFFMLDIDSLGELKELIKAIQKFHKKEGN